MDRYATIKIRDNKEVRKVRISSALKPEIQNSIIDKWQSLIDTAARIVNVPAGLVKQLNEKTIKVFLKSDTDGNPYKKGEEAKLSYGMYCETLIGTQQKLLIPDATKIDTWKENNPDVDRNMISYLGYPVNWPDGEVFGTVCLLDSKENHFNSDYDNLLRQIKAHIEKDLELLLLINELNEKNQLLEESEKKYRDISASKEEEEEEELRRKEILFRSSVESPMDMIILSLDRDYRYFYFNETHKNEMKTAYGRSPVIGDCIFDFMTSEEDIQKIKERYEKGLEGESNISVDEYGVKVKRYYEIRINPIRDDNKHIIGITSFAYDITEKKQREQEILLHQAYLGALKDIGILATSTLDSDELLDRILDGALKAIGTCVGMIFMKDPDTRLLSLSAAIGLSDDFISEFHRSHVKPMEGLSGRIAESGETVFIKQDSSNDSRIARDIVRKEGLNSFIGVPIYAKDEIIGVLNILSRPPKELDEMNVALMEAIGTHVGSAINNARLFSLLDNTKEALVESEAKHKEAQRVAKIGHWELEGIDTNPKWSDEVFRIFGIEPGKGEPSFTKHDTIIHPEEWPVLVKAIKDGFSKGKPFNLEFRILRPGDEVGWMNAIGEAETDQKGKTIRMHGTAQDITMLKSAQQEIDRNRRESETWIQNTPVCIKKIDLEFNLRFMSKAGIRELKVDDVNKLYGAPYPFSFFPENTQKQLKDVMKQVKDSCEIKQIDNILADTKGNRMWYNHILVPVKDNKDELDYLLIISSDISARKESEKRLIKAKEMAEESDRLKSAFLANMSHEIRTPMNGILGFTDILKEPGLSGEEKEKYIKIIEKSGDRMLATVNDIINISKIDSGMMEVSGDNIDVIEEISNQYTFFEQEARSKGIDLIFNNMLPQEKMLLRTDRVKFNSIVSNLVKNAIKFSDTGSIEIICRKRSTRLEVRITDTGIGIPEERIDTVFNRFIQADIDDTQARQGSGLGLSITKAYIEMLGGDIGVESEEGKGSTFYFSIPWNKAKEKTTSRKPDNEPGRTDDKKFNILIVEDDDISYQHLQIITRSIANNIVRLTNGKDAVEYMKKNNDTQLILMDIKLPLMNGNEATREIRKFNRDVIIIAQTAYGLAGDREREIEAGCNEYIAKPINKEKLLLMIKKYL